MKKLLLIFFLMIFIFFTFNSTGYSKTERVRITSIQESLEFETNSQGIVENDTITRLGTNVAGKTVFRKHLAPVFGTEG